MSDNDELTLTEARTWLFDNVSDGARCPCCEQWTKRYKRKLNSGMAASLIWLVRRWRSGEGLTWVDIQREGNRQVLKSREMGKLKFWGLIEAESRVPPEKKHSGKWRPTQRGEDFVDEEIQVPSHIFLYNNEYQGQTTTLVGIRECLGDHFSYEELMGE